MRMTARMFGVLCAASLVFCAACDGIGNKPEDENNDKDKDKTELGDDDGGKKEDEVSYDVGSIVKFEGKDYLVIRNTEAGNTVAEQSPAYHYYPNARADAYRDQLLAGLLERHDVKKPYVIMFNTETTKTIPTTGSSWDDEYLVLCGKQKYYRLRYRWENLLEDFATLTADDLRKGYAPSCFVVDMYSAAYGSDLSKKSFLRYKFNYNVDKKTIAYTDDNLRQKDESIDFVYINGNERNQYASMIGPNVHNYTIRNPNNSNYDHFFEFQVKPGDDSGIPKYNLIASGKGTLDDTATNKDYQNTLHISKLRYYSDYRDVWFKVTPRKNNIDVEEGIRIFTDLEEHEEYSQPDSGDNGVGGNDVENKDVSDDSSENDTDGSPTGTKTLVVKNKGVDKYVTVSKTTKSVNGITVPDWITFSVPFEDENAPMSKFTKVTFVPKAKDDYVIYVPKKSSKTAYEFIDNFKAGYGIFGEYKWERPSSTSTPSTDSSVTLQDDATAKADTSTARFNFTGNSFRIEMEAMSSNSGVSIETDATASGGKAGILTSEDSRAEAIITFPAGNYTGYAVIYAPSGDHDAFYVKFGDGHIRVYADDPPPSGYKPTSRTPIKLSCDKEVTVRMVISPRSEKFTGKAVETGMYIDYVEFTKD
ncbi:MAG: hypothetical protein K2I74_03095 [Treponemataceae bacterium]|nr:hypothetical protein [Treponemataceae bacterium]